MRRATLATGLATLFVLVAPPQAQQRNPLHAMPPSAPTTQVCDEDPADDYVQRISAPVEGDPLEIAVSARFGGAVESLTWRGKEFINIYDHGRQIRAGLD